MALRSVLARRRLCTQGQKVTATVGGHRAEAGMAVPMCWPLLPQAAAIGCTTRSLRGARALRWGTPSPYIMTPETRKKMYVEGDRATLGAEVLYAVLGVALLVLTVGIAR